MKKLNKTLKNIIGLFLFSAIIFVLNPINSYADTKSAVIYHIHSASGSLKSGSALSDDAAYLSSGGCYQTLHAGTGTHYEICGGHVFTTPMTGPHTQGACPYCGGTLYYTSGVMYSCYSHYLGNTEWTAKCDKCGYDHYNPGVSASAIPGSCTENVLVDDPSYYTRSCNLSTGSQIGAISIVREGGSALKVNGTPNSANPYLQLTGYSWNTGATTQSISFSAAGTYTCKVSYKDTKSGATSNVTLSYTINYVAPSISATVDNSNWTNVSPKITIKDNSSSATSTTYKEIETYQTVNIVHSHSNSNCYATKEVSCPGHIPYWVQELNHASTGYTHCLKAIGADDLWVGYYKDCYGNAHRIDWDGMNYAIHYCSVHGVIGWSHSCVPSMDGTSGPGKDAYTISSPYYCGATTTQNVLSCGMDGKTIGTLSITRQGLSSVFIESSGSNMKITGYSWSGNGSGSAASTKITNTGYYYCTVYYTDLVSGNTGSKQLSAYVDLEALKDSNKGEIYLYGIGPNGDSNYFMWKNSNVISLTDFNSYTCKGTIKDANGNFYFSSGTSASSSYKYAIEGEKTWYIYAVNKGLQWSNQISVTTRYDATAPTPTGLSAKNASGSALSSGAWSSKAVTLTGSASDNASGIAAYYFSTSSAKPAAENGNWQTSNSFTINKNCNTTYYMYVKDKAGNVSNSYLSFIVRIDMTAPTVSMSKNTTAWVSSVVITVSASDSESGIASSGYRYNTNDGVMNVTKNAWTNNTQITVTKNGDYSAEVKNGAGISGGSIISITNIDTVTPQIKLTGGSSSYVNTDLTLTCDVTDKAYLPPSGIAKYEWYKDGVLVTTTTTNTYTVSISQGSTVNSTYGCKVTSNVGKVSNTATATVKIDKTVPNPVITGKTSDNNNYSSEWTDKSVTLTVSDSVSHPSGQRYQWYKDGVAISGATSTTITMSDNQNSAYACRITTGSGTMKDSAPFYVRIDKTIPKSAISAKTEDGINYTEVWINKNVILTCKNEVSQISPITYQWYKDGISISGATSSTYTVTTTSDKDIDSVYKCEIIQSAGLKHISNEIHVLIDKKAPVISINLIDPTVWAVSKNANVSVSDNIELKNYTESMTEGTLTYTNKVSASDKVTFTVTFDENGTYKVKAEDIAGNKSEKSITITVIDHAVPDIALTSTKDNIWHNSTVVLTALSAGTPSGIGGYYFSTSNEVPALDDIRWQTSNTLEITEDQDQKWYAFVKSNTGVISEVSNFVTTKIDTIMPIFTGLETVKEFTRLNIANSETPIIINCKATDNVSGIRELTIKFNNVDNGLSRTYSTDATKASDGSCVISTSGDILTVIQNIILNKDDELFLGSWEITVYVEDIAGNYITDDVISGGFYVTAEVKAKIRDTGWKNSDIILKGGETAIMKITTKGYVDSLKIDFSRIDSYNCKLITDADYNHYFLSDPSNDYSYNTDRIISLTDASVDYLDTVNNPDGSFTIYYQILFSGENVFYEQREYTIPITAYKKDDNSDTFAEMLTQAKILTISFKDSIVNDFRTSLSYIN